MLLGEIYWFGDFSCLFIFKIWVVCGNCSLQERRQEKNLSGCSKKDPEYSWSLLLNYKEHSACSHYSKVLKYEKIIIKCVQTGIKNASWTKFCSVYSSLSWPVRTKEVVQRGSCRYGRASLCHAGSSALKHGWLGKWMQVFCQDFCHRWTLYTPGGLWGAGNMMEHPDLAVQPLCLVFCLGNPGQQHGKP